MNTPKKKRPTGNRQGVYANLEHDLHERMHRRAAAADHKAAKYVAVALDFYMDVEDAFGGPLTEQFRAMIVRNVSGMAAKMEKLLKEGA
jgi:thermostable 8-oxoguanine DNA glycosylase